MGPYLKSGILPVALAAAAAVEDGPASGNGNQPSQPCKESSAYLPASTTLLVEPRRRPVAVAGRET